MLSLSIKTIKIITITIATKKQQQQIKYIDLSVFLATKEKKNN